MKKIDKRACRKVAQEPVYIHPGNALLYIPDILYVLRSSVRNISGKRLLVIYFIPVKTAADGDTTPKYVLFQGKDDFTTLENCDDGKTRWRTAKTRWMDDVTRSVCAFLTLNDSKRVIRFCDPRIEIAFEALSHLQHKIRTAQGKQRHINRKNKIAQLMRPVDRKPLPKDLQEWMHWNVIPAHIFYRRRKGKIVADGYIGLPSR